ncbi:MAG: anthranilate synthase component I [Nitrososphaerales archaeon]|nr:anthranilate synthase component I [Nitrososphaerales archaeon]
MTIFGYTLALPHLELKTERLRLRNTPQELFAKLQDTHENSFLLESAKGTSRLAEYSFIGFEPSKMVSAKDGKLEIADEDSGSVDRIATQDPLEEIRRMVPQNSVSGLFRFVGGAVGYISYDSIRYWERLPKLSRDKQRLPDMEFGLFTDGVVFDHTRGEAYYYCLGKSRAEEVRRASRSESPSGELCAGRTRSSLSRDRFEEMILKAKDYITSGDIFQVVLSRRFEFEVEGDLTLFYSTLSKINPSPYMYFLKFGKRQIIGSSPEMLARVEDGRLETFPIAGTRPRVKDRKMNEKLTEDLLADPKESAEHVMLVDLARNDVGRVSKYGSVKAPEFLTVQQFSHVQHIVSHVVGELQDGQDSYDALRALFPAGTVSGAPKVRAMEIIEELEPVRRGPYAGAVGYFSLNGNADFAITIRTLVADGRDCSVQAGAGIVADSVPESEWEETEAKAAALLKAVETASGEKR